MKQKYFYLLLFTIISLGACASINKNEQKNSAAQNSIVTNVENQSKNNQAIANSTNANPTNQSDIKAVEDTTEVLNYENAEVALEAGKKFFDRNEDEKAVRAFEQAVKLDPNLADAHFRLAVAYDLFEESEKAQKSYLQAVKIYQKQTIKNPKDAHAFFYLGRAYDKTGDEQKAQKALQQAVKLQPEDGEYHYELGTVLIELAQYPEALKELKKAIEIDPENARAQTALEKAEAGNKRVQSARNQNKNGRWLLELTWKKPGKMTDYPISLF